LRAEAHDVFDARAIIPPAVEEHYFAFGRQLRHVALEIPLTALALGRRRQRDNPTDSRIERLGNAFNHAALASRIAPLEQDHDP
jgi:hypothetical protein